MMLWTVVCGLLIIAEQHAASTPVELQVKVEILSWQSKHPPKGNILAKAKTAGSLEIRTRTGKRFAAKATIGDKTLNFSGLVSLKTDKKANATINMSFGNRESLQKEGTTVILSLGERVILGGLCEQRAVKNETRYVCTGTVITVTRHPGD